jgi:hypothetical protein
MAGISLAPPELDIFAHTRFQNAILGNQVTAIKPINAITQPLSVLEFFSSGSNDFYRDLSHVYLRLMVCFKAEDGGNMILDNGCGVVNNLLFSMFQTLEVYLNEKLITRVDHFGYKSYLETLLNYSSDAAKTQLTSSLFFLDTPSHITRATDENLGFKARKDSLAAGKMVELYGRLKCDIFNQSLLLPQGLDLRIKLTFAPERFYMWFPNAVSSAVLHVIDSTLYVKHVMINPGVLIAHAKTLAQTNAVYPLKRVEMKTFTVAAGSRSISLNSICSGKLPTFMCFTMTNNSDFIGNSLTNSLALIHKSIQNLSIYANNLELRFGPMDFHTENKNFAYAYHSLFNASGVDSKNVGNLITPELYSHGAWMICTDFTPDGSGNVTHSSIPNAGVVRLEATFAEDLDQAVTCICLLEFDGLLEITKERNCYVS